jgi:hypothetical protein
MEMLLILLQDQEHQVKDILEEMVLIVTLAEVVVVQEVLVQQLHQQA